MAGIIAIIMESSKIHFEVPNYALWYNWLILIIGVELTMIVAATGILIVFWFLTPKQVRTLKWFTIKKKSHKTTFTFELLEEKSNE